MPTWEILLEGAAAERAQGAVEDIAKALVNPPVAWIPEFDAEPFRIAQGVSLGSGSPALALFFAYYGRSLPAGSAYRPQVVRFLEYTATGLEVAVLDSGFMYGLPGVLWALHHVSDLTGEPLGDLAETLAEADALLEDMSFDREGFDLWFGLVGHGVYALPRAAEPSARRLLDNLLDRLFLALDPDPQAPPWVLQPSLLNKPKRVGLPIPHTQLGVAHGVTGLLAFLAEAQRAGLGDGRIPALCDRVWRWLEAQGGVDEQGNFWPNFVAKGIEPRRSLERWCNGMPGIAGAVLAAARKLEHQAMEEWALARAREMAEFTRKYATFDEVSLCHGTSCIAHIYNRLFQRTRDELFADMARRYLGMTLDLQRPGYGVGGFTAHGTYLSDELVDFFDPGLMNGAAGAGLVLLAGVSGQVPHWDRAILLS